MFLNGHKASFDNFLILLKEKNTFKIHLRESLLISRGKPILNKNIHSFSLELFDRLYCYFYSFYGYLYNPMLVHRHNYYSKIMVTVKIYL